MARTPLDDAEASSGLMAAVIQMTITLGVALGGTLFERMGYQANFRLTALPLLAPDPLICVPDGDDASPL